MVRQYMIQLSSPRPIEGNLYLLMNLMVQELLLDRLNAFQQSIEDDFMVASVSVPVCVSELEINLFYEG